MGTAFRRKCPNALQRPKVLESFFFNFLTLGLLFPGDGGSFGFTSVSQDQSGRQSTPPKGFPRQQRQTQTGTAKKEAHRSVI